MSHLRPSTPRLDAASRWCAWAAAVGVGSVALAAGWRAVLLAVAVALGGCAALPGQVDRPASFARQDVAGSALARTAAASLAGEHALATSPPPGLDGAVFVAASL